MAETFKCGICTKYFTSVDKRDEHMLKEHQELKSQQQLIDKCTTVIWDALVGDGTDPNLRNKSKLALGYLGVVAKREQSQSAREATTFMMARALADDKEELARYIRATMPSSRIVKELPEEVEKAH